jgi:hypothetical protein
VFTSCSCLWTDFDCGELSADKARVYLERSKSSPIHLRLDGGDNLSPQSPFLQIIPHSIGRLESLTLYETFGNLQEITAHLSSPAPLLEYLFINSTSPEPRRNPVLTTTLFSGDLSSLRELCLYSVHTELPWRNMVNLTSFTLSNTSPRNVPIRQFLGFVESAPHLREIELFEATPTSGTQNGRLVSLTSLEKIEIFGDESPSLLLDHLIIPVGAELTVETTSRGPLIEGHFPGSLDNLRNLPNFTGIHLHVDERCPQVEFTGPNGRVSVARVTDRVNSTYSVLESLARFDTSKTERLKIGGGNSPPSDYLYQVLLPMKHLRTLTLSLCTNSDVFIHALDPSTSSPEVAICPELKELIIDCCAGGKKLNLQSVIGMAAARALRGAKLEAVRIVHGQSGVDLVDVLELRKYVWHVDYCPGIGVVRRER